MARLNIEDKFFLEIGTIARQFASDDAAIGNAIRFFRYAQEKHKLDLYVTEQDFAALGFSEALFPLFARRTPEGIVCAGAEKFFGWLAQKTQAGRSGGKASVESRRAKTGSAIPSNASNAEANRSEPEAESSAAEPSSSSSSSSSSSDSPSCSSSLRARSKKASRQPADAVVPVGQVLIAHYCDEYKKRYPTNPVIRPQDSKGLKSLGEALGLERVKVLLAGYLRMSNSWFITKAHDLATFLQSLNQVQNFVETGQIVTLQDARNAESSDSLQNQVARLTGDAS